MTLNIWVKRPVKSIYIFIVLTVKQICFTSTTLDTYSNSQINFLFTAISTIVIVIAFIVALLRTCIR